MKLSFKIAAFHSALRACVLHASKDTTRPHLNSVLVRLLESGRVDMVATDGHRLAIYRFYETDVTNRGDTFEALIPLDDCLAWLKLAGKEREGDITIDTEASTLATSLAPRALTFTKLHVPFPSYAQVLPKTVAPHVAACNPAYLLDACTAFRQLARDAKVVRGTVPNESVMVRGGESLDPIQVTCPEIDNFAIVIMPMREKGSVAPLASMFPLPAPSKGRKAA